MLVRAMTLSAFKASLAQPAPPEGVSPEVRALWHDAAGDWQQAHAIVQDIETREAAWVHAYLHRKEGDVGNAGYWYRRAGQPACRTPLDDEWEAIAGALLEGR